MAGASRNENSSVRQYRLGANCGETASIPDLNIGKRLWDRHESVAGRPAARRSPVVYVGASPSRRRRHAWIGERKDVTLNGADKDNSPCYGGSSNAVVQIFLELLGASLELLGTSAIQRTRVDSVSAHAFSACSLL